MNRTERIARRMDQQLGIVSDYPPCAPAPTYPSANPADLPTHAAHLLALRSGEISGEEAVATQLALRDARIVELEAALAAKREADRFDVQVQVYEESCGTSYFVTLFRPERSPEAKGWEPGTWTVSQHGEREHAESEAEELRLFMDLGTPLSDL